MNPALARWLRRWAAVELSAGLVGLLLGSVATVGEIGIRLLTVSRLAAALAVPGMVGVAVLGVFLVGEALPLAGELWR